MSRGTRVHYDPMLRDAEPRVEEDEQPGAG